MTTLIRWLKMPSFWIPLLTLALLALHPLPICFDCEGNDPWGTGYVPSDTSYDLFAIWFVSLSFAAGAFRMKKGWLLPIGLTIADLATQHLGGVEGWSLRANEGPVILIAGLFFGYTAFSVGIASWAVASLVRDYRSSRRDAKSL